MTQAPSLPILVLLVACTEPTVSDGDEAPGDPPSPYIVPEGDPPEPTASLADVGAALQEALDLAFTVHGGPVHDAYDKAMEGASGDCPYVYTTPDGSYWYDNCVSDAGTAFDGYVFSLDADEVYDETYGFTYSFWYAFGGATVVDAQGNTLEVGGGAVTQKVSDQIDGVNLAEYYSLLEGTFDWDGAEASGTWLETEIDPDLELYAYAATDFGVSYVQLAGGFGGILDGWAVAFDTNGVGAELLGFPCETELSGTIGVRAPDGSWTDVQFDGAVTADALDTFDEASCDGCGRAYFQGEALGEICVDVSTLLAAGVAPW